MHILDTDILVPQAPIFRKADIPGRVRSAGAVSRRYALTVEAARRRGRGAGGRAALVEEIGEREGGGDQLSLLLKVEDVQRRRAVGRHYSDSRGRLGGRS